jgi:hypothetical protein
VERLGVLFSDQLLLAALDLIDRDCGKGTSFLPTRKTETSSYDSHDVCVCVRVRFHSDRVRFPLGPKPLFRPRDDGLVRRFPKPASIVLHPILLHMPGFLLCRLDFSFSDHGACTLLE